MAEPALDPTRERRIEQKIVVDAYGHEERTLALAQTEHAV